jgi:hypothetical protein
MDVTHTNERPALDPRRVRWGWVLSALGLLLMLAGVLYLTSSAIGGRVGSFADRRTYNQVKTAAQHAWPASMLIALSGLGLMIAGSRLRTPRG